VPGRQDWSSLAASADVDELRELILTGFKAGKPFTPYVPTLTLPSPLNGVLDFGCGLGRNFPYLESVAGRVVGFDLPPMIARCRALVAESSKHVDVSGRGHPTPGGLSPRCRLEDNWESLRAEHFDLIFTALVLQHIETASCRAYLADFARMTPAVYLLTRTDSDFGANVLELVEETGAFDAGPCVEVDHDADTHQLRTLGRTTLAGALAAGGSRHYEVLLRSRSTAHAST
jgi:SAM-dependent methyltransferase